MATLDSLKLALRQKAAAAGPSQKQSLPEAYYSAGFSLMREGVGWTAYRDFVIPRLSELLSPLCDARPISILEVGPGPETVLRYLPDRIRRKIGKYTALEPNGRFAQQLQQGLRVRLGPWITLPCVQSQPRIHQIPFTAHSATLGGAWLGTSVVAEEDQEKFDVILFCHSMYGMQEKDAIIRKALGMLVKEPRDGLVVVFHRQSLSLDGLVSHRTASFPAGMVGVPDIDHPLDCFAAFVAGFPAPDEGVRAEWRAVCRALGRREDTHKDILLFSAPEVMVAFNRGATALPELTREVPLALRDVRVKNREARAHRPAAVVRPIEIRHVQECARWAFKHEVGLTVIGGGHSDHCLWPNVVAVDMGAFNEVAVLSAGEDGYPRPLVVAGAGCKTEDIVRAAMAAGLTVPLGARPSVGAGLWLQGGIGHLARLHGLACDSIVGAVMVSVESGEVCTVGCVPSQHRPVGAVDTKEGDLLWAIKGAATNFGIMVSVVFKAVKAPTYRIRNWNMPLVDRVDARDRLCAFDELAAHRLPTTCSTDAYVYWDDARLRLGFTSYSASTTEPADEVPPPAAVLAAPGVRATSTVSADGISVFGTEMYIADMHGGHGCGKTSSFKRCLFLKQICSPNIADLLVAAIETRPTPLCYLHLLHGGGAVRDVAAASTAFGCRDWNFACVITGVWPRELDETPTAQAVVRWVYQVARQLLPVSTGVYGADLGPDPRDALLAVRAFGPNLPRLARLKQRMDPRNVLAYTCPIPKAPMGPGLIVLVTGECGAGKDHCANLWVSVFSAKGFKASAVSISEATKREYAAASGADPERLLHDRAYKEQHRAALAAFFWNQVQQRPQLPEEHFLRVVRAASDVDVLFVTGMRDTAPVASFSHLVPDSRLLEVRVGASAGTLQARRLLDGGENARDGEEDESSKDESDLGHHPDFLFDNNVRGDQAARNFANRHLLPFFNDDLQRLASMVPVVSNFPRRDLEFRHVLNIPQQTGGLALCTYLLQSSFTVDWAKVDAIACCEAGGFVFASALASRINVPLVLARKAGKLPQPTIAVTTARSHISSSAGEDAEERIEMDRDVVRRGASVLVVDDVLATGRTLCAVLRLLREAGVGAEDVRVLTVAEFPVHRGRGLLRAQGFGRVRVQSLLVFGSE